MFEDHVAAARACLARGGNKLNAREVDFLRSMVDIRWPSPKQLGLLGTLVLKASELARSAPWRGRRATRRAQR